MFLAKGVTDLARVVLGYVYSSTYPNEQEI